MTRPSMLSLLTLLLLSMPLHADGVYVPEVAFAAEPSIPHQRALISWRDGTETLVVESTFQSASPSVGWLLPLPDKPTKLEVADPGMLKSLDMCIQPVIHHDLYEIWIIPLILAAAFLPIGAVMVFIMDRQRRISAYFRLGVLYIFLLLLLPPFFVTAGRSFGTGTFVHVLSTQHIGNYDVSVLRAKSPEDLSRWLTAHGLRELDELGSAIVADYVARHWCFLVAQLRHEGQAPATPHPIAATFPASGPVYPMKLTALAGSTTRVELFVVADQMAQAKGFHLASADRYDHTGRRPEDPPSYYSSHAHGLIIGSPDVAPFLWQDCVVTRLSADLTPGQMSRDVELTLSPLVPHRDHVYSARGRRELVFSILLFGALPVLIFLAVILRQRRRPGLLELKVLVVVVAGIFLVAAYVWTTSTVIPIRSAPGRGQGGQHMYTSALLSAARDMARNGVLHADMTPDELARFPQLAIESKISHLLRKPLDNPFTGEPMTLERTPGNFSTRRIDYKTYFCLYDEFCRELYVELPAAPASVDASSATEPR